MRTNLKWIALFLFSVNFLFAQEKEFASMVMEGISTGKNILIKNPYGKGGVGFCVREITVNNKVTTDEVNATMFWIDLGEAGVKAGDKIKVEIKYRKDCLYPSVPIVMNPGVLMVPGNGKESTLIVEGKFLWQNIFVTNQRVNGTDSYGIKEVLVNGKAINTNIQADIFEINLTSMGLREKDPIKDGEKIKIEFKYQTGYDPLILNPESIN